MKSSFPWVRTLSTIFLLLWPALQAQSLGPHELLVLVNDKSLRSKEVANAFVRQRNIPLQNVVYLDLPDSALEPAAEISPADFTRMIWEPAHAAARARGIEDHLLAWIYSADFPIRVTTDPIMSLQGITFTRNSIPPAEVVQKGAYISPLFAGPDPNATNHPGASAHSLEGFCQRLQAQMPLPSMMLGFTGSRGSDVESVLRVLRRGLLSDHTTPSGIIFFITNKDVRSNCRAWQYAGAQQELERLRVTSRIMSDFPKPAGKVMGLMCGLPWIDTDAIKNALPGCIAEHLTSLAACFDTYDQSKATEWLNAGAVASAGTVTEPMAIWTKFPHARLFVHYAMGCTILESFYQAIRCPLQILLLGEPLAAPWSPGLSMVLVQVDDGSVSNQAGFHAQIFPTEPHPAPDYLFLLDGRSLNVRSKPDVEVNTRHLADGYHELRVVAYLQGAVRHQVFATTGFVVNRKTREVRLKGLSADSEMDLFHPVKWQVSALGKPDKVGVMSGERVLAISTAGESGVADAVVDPRTLGPGRNTIQAFAEYADGDRVRGEPISLNVAILDQAPVIEQVEISTNTAGRLILIPRISDAEKDVVDAKWFQILTALTAVAGRLQTTDAGIRLIPPADGFGIAVCSEAASANTDEMTAGVRFSRNEPSYKNQYAGLVFDFKDARNFSYFGLFGDGCAWALGMFRDGKITWKATRGTTVQPEKEYVLSVRKMKTGGIECRVNDERLMGTVDQDLGSGPVGFMAAATPAEFRQPAVHPPAYPVSAFRMEGPTLSVSRASAVGGTLLLRASDGHRSAWKSVSLALP